MRALTFHQSRWLGALLVALFLLGGCGAGKGKKIEDVQGSIEPDKVLYERAMQDIKKNRHAIARLTLQTLINTYPDSEYLAKAKLAIADSYFKEGGTEGCAQAVIEYKDFITFFPFLDEAAYAQMQMALCHYRRMEKPDRDRTYAVLAEQEFQNFLLKYPNHPLTPQAEQRLREVQEVLAEGDFRIALFYFRKGSLRASAARLLELTDRYPLYSQSDRALWMLADIYERAERSEISAKYYSRIVSEYPLSDLVGPAKERLIALGVPVPQPNPEALARMQKEQELAREGTTAKLRRQALGMFKSGPDVSMAARTGSPNLTPPAEPVSPTQAMTPGSLSVGVATPNAGGSASGSSGSAGTTNPTAADPSNPEKPATEAGKDPATIPQASDAEKKKKQEEEKKKKEKESSSKKKKGLRKIIPW